MYGVKTPILTGFAVLPLSGQNRILFVAAIGLIAVGLVLFAASRIAAAKARKSAASN